MEYDKDMRFNHSGLINKTHELLKEMNKNVKVQDRPKEIENKPVKQKNSGTDRIDLSNIKKNIIHERDYDFSRIDGSKVVTLHSELFNENKEDGIAFDGVLLALKNYNKDHGDNLTLTSKIIKGTDLNIISEPKLTGNIKSLHDFIENYTKYMYSDEVIPKNISLRSEPLDRTMARRHLMRGFMIELQPHLQEM